MNARPMESHLPSVSSPQTSCPLLSPSAGRSDGGADLLCHPHPCFVGICRNFLADRMRVWKAFTPHVGRSRGAELPASWLSFTSSIADDSLSPRRTVTCPSRRQGRLSSPEVVSERSIKGEDEGAARVDTEPGLEPDEIQPTRQTTAPGSTPRGRCRRRPRTVSDSPGEEQDQEDDEDYSQPSTGVVTPTTAIRPVRQGSDEEQDQYDQ